MGASARSRGSNQEETATVDDSGINNGKNNSANKHSSGRPYTISVAVGSSCIENTQSLELGTLLAGQIARACAIFNVDEVVVFDDGPNKGPDTISAAAALFARVLQFMETPQYLRKALIGMHQDLRYAGMLPPLDAPHHLRSTEWGPFREGVVRSTDPTGGTSFVDVGLEVDAHVDQALKQGARVTLRMGEEASVITVGGVRAYKAELATPAAPREENGQYWGYITRVATSLESLVEDCPFTGGYDLTVGTSERGEQKPCCDLRFPKFRHALIVFGGPQGLEYALQNDPLQGRHPDPSGLFHRYLNTCHQQGSRTIRTEEAILVSMAFLDPALHAKYT